ncbi:MAG: glycosyltransferase [Armatimonadota bacterium]|nr:glycosyltransferase [Armatimonadota bacterium]MDR7549003.1 glycosyltransferase [Armatimonadota bacterium]
MWAAPSPKVSAVILTHNRLEGAALRCHEVLRQSRPPDEVILVDNASADGTAEHIAAHFPQVGVLRLPENLGPAGGFAAGFTEAMRRGCDFIWALDDDVVVSPRCLEYLLTEAGGPRPRVVFPTRLPLDQKHGVAWRAMLIPAEIVRTIGVPRADLFWHLEDTEYFLHRIRDLAGYEIAVSPRAAVWHGTHRPRRGFPGWKLYYQTRNSVFYRFHLKKGWWRRLKTVVRIGGRMAVIFFREERGPHKAWMMARGFKDGLLGILGKTIDPRSEPPSAYGRDGEGTAEWAEAQDALRRWETERGALPVHR